MSWVSLRFTEELGVGELWSVSENHRKVSRESTPTLRDPFLYDTSWHYSTQSDTVIIVSTIFIELIHNWIVSKHHYNDWNSYYPCDIVHYIIVIMSILMNMIWSIVYMSITSPVPVHIWWVYPNGIPCWSRSLYPCRALKYIIHRVINVTIIIIPDSPVVLLVIMHLF